MWLDYVTQKEEGKGLENFQGGHGCMKQENRGKPKCYRTGTSNKQKLHNVEKIENHSDRIISCKIKLHGKTSLQIIQVSVPTCDHDNETVELFM